MSGRNQPKPRARGYTVVEVLVGISLLIITSSGVVALQKVATQSNGQARDLAVANQIARSWIERLRADAASWNYPSPSNEVANDLVSDTVWLNMVNAGQPAWFRPAFSALGSPGADNMGRDVASADLNLARYCTHVRLSWMFPNEVIRAEVRVAWLRAGGLGPFDGQPVCSVNQQVAYFDQPSKQPLARYNFVFLTSSIFKNTAP